MVMFVRGGDVLKNPWLMQEMQFQGHTWPARYAYNALHISTGFFRDILGK